MEWNKEGIFDAIKNNEKAQRFEVLLDDGEYAFVDYRWYKKDLALMHTFVPEDKQSRGIAAQLAKYALEYAKAKNLKIMVYCPYVAAYLKKHPEYNDLVDKKYTG